MMFGRTALAATVMMLVAVPALGSYAQTEEASTDDSMNMTTIANSTLTGPVLIGGLFPLTGDLGSTGERDLDAATLAAWDVSAHMAAGGAKWWIELVSRDTATDPDVALEQLRYMHDMGIDVVVGSMSSESLQNLKEYADKNNMAVIACCSTASVLAVPDDSVYRLAPDDRGQSAALATILEAAGKEVVVPIWRGDAYGDGVWIEVGREFGAREGMMYAGMRYPPDNTGFELDAEVLDKHVRTAVDRYGANKVAVLMVSFDESTDIVRAASAYDALASVEWLASGSSVPYVEQFAGDEVIRAFVNTVNFTAVEAMISPGERYGYVTDIIEGSESSTTTHLMYDTVWAVGKSIAEGGGAEAADIRAALPGAVAHHNGATRLTGLNEAGDVDSANYQILEMNGTSWKETVKYSSEMDLLTATAQPTGEVAVGALYSLAGDSGGAENLAAVQLGIDDFNTFLHGINVDWRLSVVAKDTGGYPDIALEKAMVLRDQGIDIIIGPGTSRATEAIKPYADDRNMTLLSCCSTAPSLAIPGDSVFRLVPDDSKQGVAMGKLLESQGIRAVVPIWVGDTYGDGLREHVAANFESRGGIVAEGVRYDPAEVDFADELGSLAGEVQMLTDQYGTDSVAVLMISISKSSRIAEGAQGHAILAEVRWFGSESLTGDAMLVGDGLYGFANMVRLTTLQISDSHGDMYERVHSRMSSTLGRDPNAYVYKSYDAAWLVGLSILKTGVPDAASVRSALADVASGYSGAFESLTLNEAGDLAYADYSVWQVADGEWTEIGMYSLISDTITLDLPPLR